jgi:heme exporter protein A
LKLRIENLAVERGGRAVLSNVTHSFVGGEAVLLLGPNGSGKTTLLRAIAGLLKPVQGVIVLDRDIDGEDLTVGEQCHLVGHANAVKPGLTVEENLVFWSHFLDASPSKERGNERGDPRAGGEVGGDRRASSLARFELAELANIPARFLSAGQARRLGLARLLLAARPIWLLDEPTVSLDAASTKLLAREIDLHVANGGLVIAATHLPLGLASYRELHIGKSAPVRITHSGAAAGAGS